MTKDTGGPAFPMQDPQAVHAFASAAIDGITNSTERDSVYIQARAQAVGGLTVRDYFAARAMNLGWKIFDEGYAPEELTPDNIAKFAYQMADAMIKARSA